MAPRKQMRKEASALFVLFLVLPCKTVIIEQIGKKYVMKESFPFFTISLRVARSPYRFVFYED